MLKFTEFVSLSGLPLKKDNYFGSKIVDFIKFVFYLEKCILRSVVVLICSYIGFTWSCDVWTNYYPHSLFGLKITYKVPKGV